MSVNSLAKQTQSQKTLPTLPRHSQTPKHSPKQTKHLKNPKNTGCPLKSSENTPQLQTKFKKHRHTHTHTHQKKKKKNQAHVFKDSNYLLTFLVFWDSFAFLDLFGIILHFIENLPFLSFGICNVFFQKASLQATPYAHRRIETTSKVV